ncbi:MAG: class I SAM-dependent methyltransferase [Caldilineaceae bacterium]
MTNATETKPTKPATQPQTDNEYALLDSGHMQKLERIGPYTLIRPAPQAVWKPRLPEADWKRVDGVYERGSDEGGKWIWHRKVSREFEILYNNLMFQIKLTNFGHMGLFPEQAANWDWLRQKIRARMQRTNDRNLYVLNLFAYTGGSTLAASQAGAHLVHLDAAKGVVDWARKNAQLGKFDERPIRWLVDDALKFVKREERRGNTYQGIILDPPSFGRGPQGEVFKIEDDLEPLLDACRSLLAKDALFILYSCHTPGFTPLVLQNQLADVVAQQAGKVESGEMTVVDSGGRALPSGAYVRWSSNQ